jgi:hypothetical protein
MILRCRTLDCGEITWFSFWQYEFTYEKRPGTLLTRAKCESAKTRIEVVSNHALYQAKLRPEFQRDSLS